MKKSKLLILGLIGTMMFTPLSYVHAMDNNTIVKENDEDQLANKLAEDLALINQATKRDYNGNIINIDFKMLRNYFGNSEYIDELERAFKINKENKTWSSCIWDKLKDEFGVTAIQGLIAGGLEGLLTAGAWLPAAKLILKILGKSAIGGVFAIAGMLAYYGVTCVGK